MTILAVGTAISIILSLINTIIVLKYVIPLQIKEASVKNGLAGLRINMLRIGVIFLVLNAVTTAFLVFIFFEVYCRNAHISLFSVLAQLLNAIGFLFVAIIHAKIYSQQYSPKQKRLHEEMSKRGGVHHGRK